tara:strand:- start:71 stop:784 length:714 start_codon:yes stop_codon:yes gene_type:complete
MNIFAGLAPMDVIAVIWFVTSWTVYSFLLDHSRMKERSLSAAMDKQRTQWMQTMLKRDLRIVDTSIMAGLQQGTAFFASTSIFAIGGTFALLSSTEEVLAVFSQLPYTIEMTRAEWETKVLGMLLVYAYAFFKFGWAYRLFNYASMLVGAVPARDECESAQAKSAILSATEMTILAGTHFNRGLRAFFFAMGFLGWFLGPQVFMVTTTYVLLVLLRRQFFSASRRAALHSLQAGKDA